MGPVVGPVVGPVARPAVRPTVVQPASVSVTFFLSLVGQLARDLLRSFALLMGLWTVVALLQLVRSHPVLAGSLSWSLVALLAASAAVPCVAAAWTIAVAASFAHWGRQGELAAAAAAGLGPRRWIAPVLVLSLALLPWTLHGVDQLYPATRAAKHISTRMALRSPAAALALLSSGPDGAMGPLCRFAPGPQGTLTDFAGVELDDHGRPARVWRAATGAVSVPEGRDVLQLRLEELVVWRSAGTDIERIDVGTLQLSRPLAELSHRATTNPRSILREADLAELNAVAAAATDDSERRAARAEWFSRLGLALAPLPLGLAAVALGLWAARWGRWAGSLAGLVLVGVVFLPLHGSVTRWAAATGPAWLPLLPGLALALAAWPSLRRWRLT